MASQHGRPLGHIEQVEPHPLARCVARCAAVAVEALSSVHVDEGVQEPDRRSRLSRVTAHSRSGGDLHVHHQAFGPAGPHGYRRRRLEVGIGPDALGQRLGVGWTRACLTTRPDPLGSAISKIDPSRCAPRRRLSAARRGPAGIRPPNGMKARGETHGWATCSVSVTVEDVVGQGHGLAVLGRWRDVGPYNRSADTRARRPSPLGLKKSCSITVSPANSRTLNAVKPYGHSIPRTRSNSPRS